MAVLASGANEALQTAPAGLTVEGAAAFLATMAQESASFRATEEYAKNGRYKPYIGRTFEMLTWSTNYRAFGAWCVSRGLLTDAETFVNTPKKLADIRWAWLGGVWFWQKNSIWAYGNRGEFLATQRAVNLGNPNSKATPVGMTVRKAWYAAWLKVGDDLLPQEEDMPLSDADVTKIADAVLNRDGQIANVFTANPDNEFVALRTALESIGKQLDAISAALSVVQAATKK